MGRVIGLDSLRFVLAFAVLLGHGAVPNIPENVIQWFPYLELVNAVLRNAFVGIAAVMAFFIISGFCIHYPYSTGKPLKIWEFYAKRIWRIGVPGLIAFVIYLTFGLYMGVVWSLICEIIYYFLYPLILKYKRKYFKGILIASFLLSYALTLAYSFLYSYNGNFHQHGYLITWMVGLPIWLLGVLLADKYVSVGNKKANIGFGKLIVSRILIWVGAAICSVLRFHADIAYGYTLPLLAVLMYFWLLSEILYYRGEKENKYLAYGGLISYSIYLMHGIVLEELSERYGLLALNPILCFAAIAISLFISWFFYIIIERASHQTSKRITFKTGFLVQQKYY